MWLDLGEYHGPSRFHAFVMFCAERTRQRALEQSYRTYVTDSLNNVPQGRYMQRRWSELIVTHDDIDVDATIEHVIERLNTEVDR